MHTINAIAREHRLKAIGLRIKNTLAVAMIVLSVMGLVTFSLFIMEESFQTVMFSTWAASDAGRWDIVKESAELGQTINNRMKNLNNWAGWIQPFSWMAYDSYGDAADQYVKSLTAKAMRNAPELYVGSQIELQLTTDSFKKTPDGRFTVRQNKVQIIAASPFKGGQRVRGVLQQRDDGTLVMEIN